LFLLHVLGIHIPRRAGIAADAFVHLITVNFERDEQVFVRGNRVNVELGEIAEETFTGVANATGVREGVFGLCEEYL
jgi:hypothetical protein